MRSRESFEDQQYGSPLDKDLRIVARQQRQQLEVLLDIRELLIVGKRQAAPMEELIDHLRDENGALRSALAKVKPVGADVLDAMRTERDRLREQLGATERNRAGEIAHLQAELASAKGSPSVLVNQLRTELAVAEKRERDRDEQLEQEKGDAHKAYQLAARMRELLFAYREARSAPFASEELDRGLEPVSIGLLDLVGRWRERTLEVPT